MSALDLTVGARYKVVLSDGATFESDVFAVEDGIVAFRSEAAHTYAKADYHVVPVAHIKSAEVRKVKTGDEEAARWGAQPVCCVAAAARAAFVPALPITSLHRRCLLTPFLCSFPRFFPCSTWVLAALSSPGACLALRSLRLVKSSPSSHPAGECPSPVVHPSAPLAAASS